MARILSKLRRASTLRRARRRGIAAATGLVLSACASSPSTPPAEQAKANDGTDDASASSPTASGSSSGSSTTNPANGTGAGTTTPPAGGANRQADGGGATANDGGVVGAGPATTVEPILPQVNGTCPTLTTGMVTISGISVQVWAGTKSDTPAPMIVYWHVTGGTSSEAVGGIGMPASVAQEITDEGGIIVSPQNSTMMGMNTGNDVWYTGDFDIADQLVACAFQQYNLDPHRIYSEGGSAGALQAGTMLFQRSNYIAAVLPNSGGYTIGGMDLQNPKHVPAIMTMHGAQGVDMVIVDFSQQSLYEDGQVATLGGFAVDCNTGLGHVEAPDSLKLNGWQFLKDHPFGVSPEPYANGLPSTFPSTCKIITAADAIANPV
jgi:hypothetical protein